MVHRNILLAFSALCVSLPAVADEPTGVERWHGQGTQIYDCQKSAAARYLWVLRQPDATLTDSDGRIRGHHSAGPSWTAIDGSRVVGRAIVAIPAPRAGAIPWLVLQAESHDGHGTLDGVTYVLRTETVGGMAPDGGCDGEHEGAVATIPYEATYSFLQPVGAASKPQRQADH
jgi:hypothetical protein